MAASLELFGLGDALDWQIGVPCAQTDPDLFYPEKGGSPRLAKEVCAGCDVRAECLQYALVHGERFGVWGGLTEGERRRLREPAGQGARTDLVGNLCRRGLHELSGENLSTNKAGHRRCLACRRVWDNARYVQRVAARVGEQKAA
jgi:WhiB family redox-sensing transcriptional regulator